MPRTTSEATGDAQRNIQKYRYELTWLEQARNSTTTSRCCGKYDTQIEEWENDEVPLTAWKHGETRCPFIDAQMRQLEQRDIHNRPRQNVASFLTKHLLVDWREGARHFRQ